MRERFGQFSGLTGEEAATYLGRRFADGLWREGSHWVQVSVDLKWKRFVRSFSLGREEFLTGYSHSVGNSQFCG